MAKPLLEVLDTTLSEFEAHVRSITADQWALPTPCPDWDVEALVRHVIRTNRDAVQYVEGTERDDSPIADDLLEAWRTTADEVRASFGAPGAMDSVLKHEWRTIQGEMLVSEFAVMRIGGYAVHTWDLARAIGADETIDPDVLAVADQFFTERAGKLPAEIFHAPPDVMPANATLEERVLLKAGRQP